ncbi:MAG TPA: hypothetical protein VHL53_12105 [Acidimicrobiia bacterium]|nr:hypothetical protein [Acidimicrobiia bacterium]
MATGLSRSKALWFPVLAGPILWFAQLNINYQWEEVEACSPSATHSGEVLGIAVRSWVMIVNVVVAAVTLAALALAVRCWRRTSVVPVGGISTTEHRRDTAHWMALAGMVNSVLFLLLIVGGFGPALILKTCQTPL